MPYSFPLVFRQFPNGMSAASQAMRGTGARPVYGSIAPLLAL
nr:MAG TPA: hypothetical protein [Caudoviricetes sp.]